MLEVLSPDTQTTLLLVGRFEKAAEAKPLSTAEYNQLAKQLLDLGLRPSDILHGAPNNLVIPPDRLTALLGRGTSLALAVERWNRLGIKVVGRSDASYPGILRRKLRGASAPILYLAGNAELLSSEAVCVVGSREPSHSGLDFAAQLGARCAAENLVVVSGDARGIDRAAMDGALNEGGTVTAVLVDALSKAVLAKRNREPIMNGKLLLVSPYDPDSTFTVPKAMDRNKYLYALSDAAVVVDSDLKGGTWTGAVENQKHGWSRAFVRLASDAALGNRRLAELGLRPIIDLNFADLRHMLFSENETAQLQHDLLDLSSSAQPDARPEDSADEEHQGAPPDSMSLYHYFVARLSDWLSEGPQAEAAIIDRFELERAQAKAWLNRAERERVVEKLKRPSRYALGTSASGASAKLDSPGSPAKLLL